MSVSLEKVIGRNNQMFGDFKKDISISLGQVREFVTTVTQKKKSSRGFKSTCEQIESFIAGCNTAFQIVHKRIWGMNGLIESAEGIDYNSDVDMAHGGVVEKLCRGATNIEKYLSHFNAMIHNGEVAKAALSIQKYRAKLVALVDNVKRYNIRSEAAVREYLASDQFAEAVRSPESIIDIVRGDLQGTPAEKKRFLKEVQERAARAGVSGPNIDTIDEEAPFIEQEDGKILVVDEDGEDEKPVVEESFNVKRHKEATGDNESDEEDETSSDEGDETCGSATTSDGGGLGEHNLIVNNQKIVQEVEKNAYIVGGRTLRNTNRLQGYSQFVTENPEFQVKDNRKSASKKKTNLLVEEGREYGEELSDSDSEQGNKGDDEIEAHLKQIEQERARALKKTVEKEVKSAKKRKHGSDADTNGGSKRHATSNGNGVAHTGLSSTFTKIKLEKVSADNSVDDVANGTHNGVSREEVYATKIKQEKPSPLLQPLQCADDE